MKHLFLSLLSIVCFSKMAFAQTTEKLVRSIYFETNSAELSPESQQALADFAAGLRGQPDFEIDIEAFTDEQGGEGFNQKLAERRAASASDFLLKNNVQPRKTAIKSFGESRQLTADSPDETRRINRRVDILATVYRFDDLSALFERLDLGQNDAAFTFSGTEENEFTTSRGTKIWVPEGAFEFENGDLPTQKINLKIREAYAPADWFLNRLGTETETGELLQTAGMLFTEASSEGRPLRLRAGRELMMAVPTSGLRDPAMQLFTGKNHPSDGLDDQKWEAVPNGQIRNSLRKKGPQTVKLPKEVADFLKNMPLAAAEKPAVPKFSEKLVEPKSPGVPAKPYYTVKKPERADFVFKPGKIRERFYSNEKKRKSEDRKFAAATQNYERGLAAYQKRLSQYEVDLKRYDLATAEYSKKHDAWRAAVKSRMATWAAYSEQSYRAAIARNLAALLKNADKLAIKNNGEPLSKNLMDMAQTYFGGSKLDKNEPYKLGMGRVLLRKTDAPLSEINVAMADKQYPTGENGTAMDQQYRSVLADAIKDANGDVQDMGSTPGFAAIEALLQLKILEMGTKIGDIESMRAYVFRTSNLGWINCDRFAKLNPADAMAIEVGEPERAMLTVILPNFKAAINLTAVSEGRYRSNLKLPKGELAKLVSLKVQDGRALLSVQEFVVGQGDAPTLKYESMPLSDLRKAMEKLNG